jgi:hypothetical protein
MKRSPTWRRALATFAMSLLLPTLAVQSSTPAQEDDFEWFDEEDLETLTARVNEGELTFLAAPPAKAVHHLQNVVILDRASVSSGWVRLQQCHSNIDKVPRAQILFNKDRVRNLRITHALNIGASWVDGASVQLTDIGEDSSLCLDADSRALKATGDGGFRIDNGPFMRRFLDGYYPMRVSERILLADSGLRFAGIEPARQPGFEVEVDAAGIRFDAWFEGRLRTEVSLIALDRADPAGEDGDPAAFPGRS